MVSKKETIQIACCVMPNGSVKLVPGDRTSIETSSREWKESLSEELKAKHIKHNTMGGVVMVTMLAEDWVKAKKELTQ